MAGLWEMVRLIFRRDRMKLPLFFGGFVAVFLLMIPMMRDVYGEPESLATMYATLGVNPAARFMVGPMDGPTLGALVMVKLLLWFGMALAFINTIFVVRHTRHNEEIGAQELLLSGPMRRGSGLAAALLVAFVVNAFVVTTLGVGMHYMEVSWDVEESWLFAVAIGVFGFVWAAIAGVVVQLVENGRSANGILALLIGVTFVLRGVGDFLATLGDDGLYYPMWMSTLSPFGWMQATRPLTHPDWMPLWISVGFAIVAMAIGFILLAQRDVGAGLLPSRKGRARASRLLATPLGLTWRLQWSVFIAWLAAIIVIVATIGALVPQMTDVLSDSDSMRAMIEAIGGVGEMVPTFMSAMMAIVCLMVFGYVLHGLTKLRGEEVSGRLENIVATRVTRLQWLTLHVAVVLIGGMLMLAATGGILALCVNLLSDFTIDVDEYMLASLSYAPVMLVFAALYLLLFGAFSGLASGVSWLYFGFVAFALWLGPVVGLDQAIMNLSVMEYVASPPAEAISWGVMGNIGTVAIGMGVVGIVAFRRRNIG